MEAARVAALKGHQVLLYEKGGALGDGQLKLAAAPPHKDIFHRVPAYYQETFKALPNIKVELGKEVTVETVSREKPDAVIIATGGKSFIPSIPGVDGPNVVTAFDVLANKAEIKGKRVIVCGGNALGCETANHLAKRNNTVTIVEMVDSIGADIDLNSLSALKDELEQDHVTILTGKRVEAISHNGVTVSDKEGNKSVLPMDMAVLALGVEPVNALAAELEGKVKELYTIGDAKKPARIHDAVSDGFFLAFHL